MPKSANIRIDGFLTETLLGYKNGRYGASNALPRVPVSELSGKIPSLDNSHLRLDWDVREVGGAANRVSFDYSSVSFDAEERTVEVPVDDRQIAKEQDPIDQKRDAAFVAYHKLALRLEDRVATLLTSTSSYASTDYYDTANKVWSGTGTPVSDVVDAVDQIVSGTGFSVDNMVGVCSHKVYTYLKKHDDIVGNYTSTTPGAANQKNIGPQQVADALGLRALFVSSARKNTAAEGATEALSSVFPEDDFVVLSAEMVSGLMPETFAGIITPSIPGYPGAEIVVDEYRDETVRSDIVRATFVCDEIVFNSRGAFLFQSVDAS